MHVLVPQACPSLRILSLTECNIGTAQKLPFAVNITIELKNIRTTYDNTDTYTLPDSITVECRVTFFRSTVSLTPNRHFLTVSPLQSVSGIWVRVNPLKDVVTNSDKGLDDDKQRIGNDVEKIGCGLLQVLGRHFSLMNEENQENEFS
jgi:hypothetical protein